MPGSSGATPWPTTSTLPFWRTSIAAMLPASISRPTTPLGLVEGISRCMESRISEAHTQDRLLRAEALSPELRSARIESVGREELVQVPVDDLVADPERDDAAEGQERAEGDRALARRLRRGERSSTPRPPRRPGSRSGPPGPRRGPGRGPSSRPASRRPSPCRAGRRARRGTGFRRPRAPRSAARPGRQDRLRRRPRSPTTAPKSTILFGMIRRSRSVSVIATSNAQKTRPRASSAMSSSPRTR